MKKAILFLFCLFITLTTAACFSIGPKSTASTATTAGETIATSTETLAMTTVETTTASETVVTTTSEAAAASSETGVSPSNSAIMYSSYAHMVSYDPARGWADFDYFTMLRGDEAVQWLVEQEGYTEAGAQAVVDDFADSEFIEKNINPQLRTIDLRDIELKLMYYPDGTMVTDANPVDSELIDLYNLYEKDPTLVLDSFFYYVTVEDGVVVAVEQVYWP